MADQKITDLAVDNTPLTADIIEYTTDPGGSPLTKSTTVAGLLAADQDPVYESLTATKNQNAITYMDVNNTTSDTAAGVGIRFDASAGGGHVFGLSAGYTSADDSQADSFHVRSFDTSSGGLILSAAGTNTIRFYINGGEVARFDGASLYIGDTTGDGMLSLDQSSTSAAVPCLELDQADVDHPFIKFECTIGAGNAIEAVGKSMTTTHFVLVELTGGLLRYIEAGTIA